jgi:hypothetical protein
VSVLLKGRSIPVKRVAAGALVGGRWQDGAPSNITITGTVHPAPTDRLQTLPEGMRVQGIRLVITDALLFQSDPLTQQGGDILTIDGFSWKVVAIAPYGNGIVPHYEALIMRVKEGT